MKKISHAIVMVEDIHSSLPRTEFSEADLDEAARLLLKIEGVITPPILLENGVDSYKVIEGHFEYYAALRAEEIDPLKGETINAYLVEDEADVAVYQKQVEVFRQQSPSPSNEMNNLEARFAALEKNILHNISELIKTLPASSTVNNPPVVQPAPAIEEKFLEDINTLPIIDLNLKLEQIKTSKKVRENILKARQNPSFQAFNSRHELIERIAGLGQKTFDIMLEKFIKL